MATEEEQFERSLLWALEILIDKPEKFRESGISNADLLAEISNVGNSWQSGGGPDMYWYAIKRGSKPAIWVTKDIGGTHGKPTFSGPALLTLCREKLNIPYPGGKIQLKLF